MLIVPTTYFGTRQFWQEAFGQERAVEVCESFPKQTYRNRCTIIDPTGKPIVLSVPVKRVDHKQLTKEVEISYQTPWQHQHWQAIMSAYKRSPYFDYYQDFLRPLYEKEPRWLVDWNDRCMQVAESLMKNHMPQPMPAYEKTNDWQGLDLEHFWGDGISILDSLFQLGPLWANKIKL